MKKFWIGVLLLTMSVGISFAAEKKVGEPVPRNVHLVDSISGLPQKVYLKTYSMNSMLFVETDATGNIYVYDLKGDLKKEVAINERVIAIPISRGTYRIKVGEESNEVTVR